MAKKQKDGASNNNKVLYIVAAVAVVGILKGFVLGGASASPAPSEPGASVTTTTEPGPIVTLEPITVNISGRQFLKIGLGLQLAGDHDSGGGGHGAKDSDDPTKGYARALDITIDVFGGRTFDELVTTEGRNQAKDELVERLKEAYHHEIEGVYFTHFVMQ